MRGDSLTHPDSIFHEEPQTDGLNPAQILHPFLDWRSRRMAVSCPISMRLFAIFVFESLGDLVIGNDWLFI